MFKFTFRQQVLTGFIISLIFVLFSAVTSYYSVKSMEEDAAWLNHTHEVIAKTESVNIQITKAESSMRGFLLTGRSSYLTPYNENIEGLPLVLADLRTLVDDNMLQSARADSLSTVVNKKLSIMARTLEENRLNGSEAGFKLLMTDQGKVVKDRIDQITREMILTEKNLLVKREDLSRKASERTINVVLGSALVIFCLILFLYTYIQRTFDQQKQTEAQIRKNNKQLSKLSSENKEKNWLLSGVAAVNEVLRGEQELEDLGNGVIATVCNVLQAPVGLFFLTDRHKQSLKRYGSYAYQPIPGSPDSYLMGEGYVGQVAREKAPKVLSSVPKGYIKISSGLGEADPAHLYFNPILFEGEVIAVLEIALNEPITEAGKLFLSTISESVAIAIKSIEARMTLRELFEQLQQQAEELETQQEELRTTNDELVYKSEQLQASEEELRVQQEELRQTNVELEEKARQLEEKNTSINDARQAMAIKADELAESNRYKSEFLANMSHELRTPLNSILILAKILNENKHQNLSAEQIKFAGVIHTAGTDLLNLINDILDLSKIESGKVELNIEPVDLHEIKYDMESLFTEVAKNKGIQFVTDVAENIPARIFTDLIRVEQIIKNLLSNALKFTPENGTILLDIQVETGGGVEKRVALSVKDSGIGIPEDKLKLIFEAFQQADGSTSRKYGGTGLGLSISKELAHLLGGEIHLESTPGVGSTFTLLLPQGEPAGLTSHVTTIKTSRDQVVSEPPAPAIQKKQDLILIVEDDKIFADVLKSYAVNKGFEVLIAYRGEEAFALALEKRPDAILLDIMLPEIDGWAVLKQLKADLRTREIPVHMMSASDDNESKARLEGAIEFLKKPIRAEQLDKILSYPTKQDTDFQLRSVLLVEDQEVQSMIVKEELVNKGIEVSQAFTGQQALELLETRSFDCMILDLHLPDISGFELLDQVKSQERFAQLPVVINTALDLNQEMMNRVAKYSEATVLKSSKSNSRLIDEVSLFINKLNKEEHLPVTARFEKVFEDKTILVTDDDMRNIFALSSALQDYNLNIVIANNGREALEKLERTEQIDLVLMDIMMPEMDGYEAMQAIRRRKEYEKLPIIALTAKAMKQDREKCLEAGANDFISKPVDIDKLLSMMRVWLS